MLSLAPTKQIAGALMGLALCVSSTAAGAATTAVPSISPLVALSAFGTAQSSSAICATTVQGAAITTAAAQAAPGAGCVLPVVDQPVPVAQTTSAAHVPVVEPGGIGLLLPVLGGLALFAALSALVLSGDEDGDINFPPVSPD